MNQGVYFGQVIVGPAGSGKSSYCHIMQDMASTLKRNILIVNLDPAAEHFKYRCDIDIKDLITLDDVMEEMELGPNGALIYCMEYLMQNTEWLQEQLNNVGTDDYVIFDCPGQIELYTHLNVFKNLITFLQNYGFSLCSIYMLDVSFIGDNSKFMSGMLQALAAQISLELPALTVMTKCDLIKNKDRLKHYLQYPEKDQEESDLPDIPNQSFDPNHPLNKAIRQILHNNSLVSLLQLDINDEETIRDVLMEADNAIQYGENVQPNDKLYDQAENYLNSQLG